MNGIAGFLAAIEAFITIAAGLSGKPLAIVNSRDLTGKMLENRNGAVIIELVFGVCEDEEGNGVSLNAADPDFSYISYADVPCAPGDYIATLLVYDPETDGVDDIMMRFDINLGGLFGVQKISGLH